MSRNEFDEGATAKNDSETHYADPVSEESIRVRNPLNPACYNPVFVVIIRDLKAGSRLFPQYLTVFFIIPILS
jgi:hypothetical protein